MQHPNARLTPRGRRELVRLVEAARRCASGRGVQRGGVDGVRLDAALARCARGEQRSLACLRDRSSRPRSSPRRCSRSSSSASARRAGRPDGGRVWSPARSACRIRRSGRCCAAMAVAPARAPREPANRYEWPCPGDLLHMDVSRYARFEQPGHAVTGDRTHGRRRRAAPRRLPVRPRHRRRPLAPGLRRAAPRRAGGDRRPAFCRTRAALLRRPRHHRRRVMTDNAFGYTKNRSLADCWPRAASATSPPSHTGPAPTAKSSASTRPWPANGPTASPTGQATPAPRPCHTGCATTTSRGRTAPSATARPSAAFATSRGRTAS